MKREVIEKMLRFLKEKEGHELPEEWFDSVKKYNLIQKLENHPDGVRYEHKGDLDLDQTNITKLPKDLYVSGNLDLLHCKKLTVLPNVLRVEGRLLLYNCEQITNLPDSLYVGLKLVLTRCKQLTKLPDNLYVGGALSISETNISELPSKLYVWRDLNIFNTPLAKKYTDEEIRKIVASTGGEINGYIFR